MDVRKTFTPGKGREKRGPAFFRGCSAGIPIIIGYFPIAVTFGMLASETISAAQAVSLSVLVFAGASQFMAIGLMASHTAAAEIVSVTFLMNFRHFLMSASIADRLTKTKAPALIGFWLTDETFSLASSSSGSLAPGYVIGIELVSYASWVAGTAAGSVIGGIIPPILQVSMYVALYALFGAILVPVIRKSLPALLTAAGAAGANALLQTAGIKPGWSLVAAILVSSGIGALIFGKKDGGEEE